MEIIKVIVWGIAGWVIGVAIRCKQDADDWNEDFFTVFQDRIMRMLGWW